MLNRTSYSCEELNLYNSAYVGFIVYTSIREFAVFQPNGMHCALPFIVVPMAMNQLIASRLPSTYKSPIASWVASNEGFLVDFVPQAEAYGPIVRAAISFLMDRQLLLLNENGCFTIGENKLVKNSKLFQQSRGMMDSLRASRFLGRWFSHTPSTETIFVQLGIRP